MLYHLTLQDPSRHLLSITCTFSLPAGRHLLQLPVWRPGRYERQAYARNIADLKAQTTNGDSLELKLTQTHSWSLNLAQKEEVQITYTAYANQPDAGGSYLDTDQIYINPINFFLYLPGREEEACELRLDLPQEWTIGGALPGPGPSYNFPSIHALLDTPFVGGNPLTHHRFTIDGLDVHLWFLGDCKPDLKRITQDFQAYSRAQMVLFGDCPVDSYHYLFMMLPGPFRHGVEHAASTVISMGPGYRLMEAPMYKSFLEISSHEFFHTWNVKALRPADLWPYDYSQEQYSALHYVTEGVTTYYGDLMLWKSGVWDLDGWIKSINGELKTHFSKPGRAHISLEQASLQSWTHQYKPAGMPERRISFYTKGYLVAMLLDWTIRKASGEAANLDLVMRDMYHQIAKAGRGYTGEDYQSLAMHYAGIDLSDFFAQYIEGTTDLKGALVEMGAYYGLELMPVPASSQIETWWGMSLEAQNATGRARIERVLPDSPAHAAGLSSGDEIISLNSYQLTGAPEALVQHIGMDHPVKVHYFHQGRLRETSLHKAAYPTVSIPQFVIAYGATTEQRARLQRWQSVGLAAPSPAKP